MMMERSWCRSAVNSQPVNLLCCLVLAAMETNSASSLQCPNNTEDTLRLRSPDGQRLCNEVIGRAGHVLDLHCCTSEQNIVTWYFWKQDVGAWTPYPWFPFGSASIIPLSSTRNQTLRLADPYRDLDAGLYRCRATREPTGQYVDHEMTVRLYECVSKERPEVTVAEEPVQYVRIGGDISALCQGDFGCVTNATSQRQAYWRKDGVKLVEGASERYSVHNSENVGRILIGSNLTIVNIQPDDLRQPFDCVLESGQAFTTVAWSLQLKETLKDYNPSGRSLLRKDQRCQLYILQWLHGEVFRVTKHYAQGTSFVLEPHWYIVMMAVVVLLIVLSVITWRLYGPQIRFHVKSTFCANYLPVNDDLPHDLAIFHSLDGDSNATGFTQNMLIPKLCGYGYSCATTNDVSADSMTLLIGCGEIMRESYSVAFVMTRISLEDPEFHLLINSALEMKYNVFCIALLEANRSESVGVRVLKDKYKGVKILTWPGEEKSYSRQRKNFWCEVRLRLPHHRLRFSSLGS